MSQKHKAGLVLGGMALVLPALALAASLSLPEVKQKTREVEASYERCVKEAGQDQGKLKQCRTSADKALASLLKDADKLVAQKKVQTTQQHNDALKARQEILALKGSIQRVERQAQPAQPAQPMIDAMTATAADKSEERAEQERPRAATKTKSTSSKGDAKPAEAKRPMKRQSLELSDDYIGQGVSANSGPRPVMKPTPDPTPVIVANQEPSYKDHGTNAMIEADKEAFSTFAADVDTGSYTMSRSKLQSGILPPKEGVRVEEFVNYFAYSYPQPAQGPFSVALEAAPSPFVAAKDRYIMRVGVQGKKLTPQERKPVHLTFLVDVSGSMNRHDKLGLAKQSLKVLTTNLKPSDTVALVTYASGSRVILEPTSVSDREKIFAALSELKAGGSTAMNDGLGQAYKVALQSFKRDHVNRVIVLSDGDANVGPASHDEILKEIKKYVDEGVTLSTIGFGMGTYRDHLMEQLANKGNGNYYYIDSIDEANKVFGAQLDGTLQVIAKDVKLQVEFNPKAVKQYRLIGYENRDVRDQDFRNDKVDAGEIGAGHTVTAMYEIIMESGHQEKDIAFVRVRHKEPEGYKASEQVFTLRPMELKSSLQDASKDFQFAAAVTGFAEILRQSPHAKSLSFSLIEEVAKAASSPNQKDRQEFIALVQKAKASQKAQ